VLKISAPFFVRSFVSLTFLSEILIFVEISPKKGAVNFQETKSKQRSKALITTTYIFVTLLFFFFSFALIPKIVGDLLENGFSVFYTGGWEGLVMLWTYIVFFIGFVIVWKNKAIGGLVIVLSSLLQMGPFLIIDLNLGSLIFGLPLLISGILFCFLSRCSQNN